MTKWEYLAVNEKHGFLMDAKGGYKWNVFRGIMMNDEEVLFKIWVDKKGEEHIDTSCEVFKKWNSNGQNQILNELGDEGWELINVRQEKWGTNNTKTNTYLFKRPI